VQTDEEISMSYYSQWLNQIEDSSNPADNQALLNVIISWKKKRMTAF
jgi:hypothetical protein